MLVEAESLLSIATTDEISLELQKGTPLIRGIGVNTPLGLTDWIVPVARGLQVLQQHTTQVLTMPEMREVTVSQLNYLARLVAIYEGESDESDWDEFSVTIPEDVELAHAFISGDLPKILSGELVPIATEQPSVVLGDASFLIEHNLVTMRSFEVDDAFDIASAQSGDVVRFHPHVGTKAVTAAVRDWTDGTVIGNSSQG